jgi:formylglycine-generating enzyme required for sulfatase activity/tRNA A-37 threonylcarbamoyl transferase component Bud32
MTAAAPSPRLVEWFGTLVELPPAERSARLAELARQDRAFAAELEHLLHHHREAGGFLDEGLSSAVLGSPAAPPQIAGYQVLEELGVGSTGVVYRAQSAVPRREVALKVLRLDHLDSVSVARFEREGQILARLRHPNLARVHAVGVEDCGSHARPWMAMELVAGERFDHASRGAHWSTVVGRLADVADALEDVHRLGIVHRDLKPANLMVDHGGRAVVLDFGLAAMVDREERQSPLLTRDGQVLGTLAYMAPEQAAGLAAEIGPAADVYSLGAVLYEVLTGVLPVDVRSLSTSQALVAVEAGRIRPLRRLRPDLPRDLESVLAKALSRDVHQRYASGGELSQDLRRLLGHRPVRARRTSVLYRARLLVRRHRGVSLAVAAVILSLALALTVSQGALRETQAANFAASHTADLLLARDLEGRAEVLWPAEPQLLAALEAWIAEAEDLERRLGDLLPGVPSGRAQGSLGRRPYRRPEQVVADLFDPSRSHGGLADVRRRRDRAAAVDRVTLAEAQPLWRETLAAIAAEPIYRGLRIAPQSGLWPLGRDPHSGLQDFALWSGPGEVPVRDGATGALAFDSRSTVILTLLPGGWCRPGRQRDDATQPNYDADTRGPWESLGAEFQLDLDPFLISKYEITQGQWVRAMGFNPSHWQAGEWEYGADFEYDERQPVETLTVGQAEEFALRLGLELPTALQHEYATRGGTVTPTWFPWEDLERGVEVSTNLVDGFSYTNERGRAQHWPATGFLAPTGCLRPNPFGLYDMAGNAGEWCREVYWVERETANIDRRDGDWIRQRTDPFGNHFPVRGGGIEGGLNRHLHSGLRRDASEYTTSPLVGFRTMRRIHGSWTRDTKVLPPAVH